MEVSDPLLQPVGTHWKQGEKDVSTISGKFHSGVIREPVYHMLEAD